MSGSLPISQLPEITTGLTANAEFPVSQDGVTYKVKTGYLGRGNLYGSFYSQNTQEIVSTTTAYPMSGDTLQYNNGVTVVDGSKFTALSGGTYNIQFSAQFQKTQGGSSEQISIWLRKNGTDLDWSTTDLTLANNNVLIVGAWNWIERLDPGGYLQIMWSATSTYCQIFAAAQRTGPYRPQIPSVIVTMWQI